MGESKLKRTESEEMHLSCSGVHTAGGRVQVRWESESAATPMGQLAYFIEFLTLTGLWSRITGTTGAPGGNPVPASLPAVTAMSGPDSDSLVARLSSALRQGGLVAGLGAAVYTCAASHSVTGTNACCCN